MAAPGHRVIVDGRPQQGATKMGHKGEGGRPANAPPKTSPYRPGTTHPIENGH
jgi:hypothetical protein